MINQKAIKRLVNIKSNLANRIAARERAFRKKSIIWKATNKAVIYNEKTEKLMQAKNSVIDSIEYLNQ